MLRQLRCCAVLSSGPGWTGRRVILAALIRVLPARLRMRRLVTSGPVLRCTSAGPRKWPYPHRTGRPPVSPEVTVLTGRPTTENQTCGYQRIQGGLLKPGQEAAVPLRRESPAPLPVDTFS